MSELIVFVISLYLKRRHLNTSQKALVALDALPFYEEAAKKRQRLSKGRGKKGVAKLPHVFKGKSRDMAAKVFGISGRYVGYAKQINEKDPELAQKIRIGKKTIAEGIKQLEKKNKFIKFDKLYKELDAEESTKIVCDDFSKWCGENIEDDSIDLILTLPPCTLAAMPLWEKLALVSKRVLRPSGFLVAYCEQRTVDRIFQILSSSLKFYWLYCIISNYPKNIIMEKWQPVFVYYKPPLKKERISKELLWGLE